MAENIKTYVDKEMCKKCGGVCCKQNGCVYMPQDFKKMDFKYLKNKIEKGNISISGQPFKVMKDGWSFILFLRARNEDSPIVDLITKGGPCSMLTEKGCRLEEEKRPSCGLGIKPTKIGGPCEKMFSSNDVLFSWLDYQDVLEDLIKNFTGKQTSSINVIVEQIQEQMEKIMEKKKNNQQLTAIDSQTISWYFDIMADKPYYYTDEIKEMINDVLII